MKALSINIFIKQFNESSETDSIYEESVRKTIQKTTLGYVVFWKIQSP